MAVIKADAYGHGLIDIAKTLTNAGGLAVARIEEALEIRNTGIQSPLLLLSSYLNPETLVTCANNAIDIVVHTNESVNTLLKTPLSKPLNIWLKLNSGMHRLGMNSSSFIEAYQRLSQCEQVNQITLMTHFSDSESPQSQVAQQMMLFDQVTQSLDAPASLANSAALIQYPETHRHWVRPGIILYGANPLPFAQRKTPLPLRQAMTLSAKIIAINFVPTDAGVGYNSTWKSPKDSIIASVGIGYGDGYPRHAKNGTPVLINGHRAVLVGTVSMDLITVDITDHNNVAIGDDVILWSDELQAEEIAPYCDTIVYELFTSISKRVPRIYIKD